MGGERKWISAWRIAVTFGAMLVFVLGIPALPTGHHWVYWTIAFAIEAVICVMLLHSH